MKEKKEKIKKEKKSKKPVDPNYIGRPKPMKTKKFEFHKPGVKFYVSLGIWVAILGFLTYIGFRLFEAGKTVDTILENYTYEEGTLKTQIIENENLRFELDPETTQFKLTQKSNGHVWYSNPQGADEDKKALPAEKNNMKSPFMLKYSTINGVETSYDFFSYSVEKNAYKIKGLSKSIEVTYSVGDIKRTYQIPMACTEEKMNEYIKDMSKKDQRTITSSYRKYDINKLLKSDDKNALLQQYPMLAEQVIYVISEKTQEYRKAECEQIFKANGYTKEMYEEDLKMYAGAKEKVVPGFNVTVIYTLDKNNLIVEIPFDRISYKTDYPIVKITVLPYFGAGGLNDEGFLFVPEGSGSIINFNNGKVRQNAYYADVYGWDYGQSRKAVVTETRTAFPVIGAANGDSSFISIIENGSQYAGVNADISGKMGSFNYVNFEYRILHSELFEASERTQSSQMAFEKYLPEGESIKQVYTFSDEPNYSSMAKLYRNYLFGDKATLKNKSTPCAIEIIGAIEKVQQYMGMPKTLPYKLTTYSEASNMITEIDDMGIKDCYIKLSGFFNEGVRQTMLSKFKLINKLGGKSEFKKLVAKAADIDAKLYLDGTVQFAYRSDWTDGFSRYRSTARMTNNKILEIPEFSPVTFGKVEEYETYYMLKSKVSDQMAANLSKYTAKYKLDGVSYRDNGYLLGGDYNSKEKVSRAQNAKNQVAAMEEAKKNGLGVMINAGNDYAVKQADIVTNMVFHGNDYAIIDRHVPFYQIALHGNVNFTGIAVNNAPESKQVILEAAEGGAGLNFCFIGESEKALQETKYTEYYASCYETWKPQMEAIYNEYNQKMAKVTNARISNHRYLSDKVTETTYENGVKVLVNFGYVDYVTDDGVTLASRDFKVMEAR